MYYLELIERFWVFNKTAKISPVEISLYFYLLKISNENNRYDFKISDNALGRELGLNIKTIKSTKDKLKNSGLIDFKTTNGTPCYYRLLLQYSFDFVSKRTEEKEIIYVENIHKSEALEILPESDLFNIDNINVPSYKEFLEYAKSLTHYESTLDSSIKIKYEAWKHKGWRNISNHPIKNWKSTLKSTLPYLEISNVENPLSLQDIPKIKRPELKNNN